MMPPAKLLTRARNCWDWDIPADRPSNAPPPADGRTPSNSRAASPARKKPELQFQRLETALRYYLKNSRPIPPPLLADIAASYQEAIVDALSVQALRAADRGQTTTLAAAGGVSFQCPPARPAAGGRRGALLRLLLAPPGYCGDNAAMVAALLAGAPSAVRLPDLDACPNLRIGV